MCVCVSVYLVCALSTSIPLPRGPLVLPSDYLVAVSGRETGVVVRIPSAATAGVGFTHLVRVRAANRNGWGAFSQFFALPVPT